MPPSPRSIPRTLHCSAQTLLIEQELPAPPWPPATSVALPVSVDLPVPGPSFVEVEPCRICPLCLLYFTGYMSSRFTQVTSSSFLLWLNTVLFSRCPTFPLSVHPMMGVGLVSPSGDCEWCLCEHGCARVCTPLSVLQGVAQRRNCWVAREVSIQLSEDPPHRCPWRPQHSTPPAAVGEGLFLQHDL